MSAVNPPTLQQVVDNKKLYHIVVHDRHNKYTINQMEQFVIDKLLSEYYMICIELEETNKHFHIMAESNVSSNDTQNRKIRKLLNEFGVSGKGQLSTSLVKSRKQMMKYLLKDDGEIRTKGISETDLTLFKKLSFKKGEFKKRQQELEEAYIADPQQSTLTFAQKFTDLKVEYHQNLGANRIVEYARMMHFRKNPSHSKTWVFSILRNEPYLPDIKDDHRVSYEYDPSNDSMPRQNNDGISTRYFDPLA